MRTLVVACLLGLTGGTLWADGSKSEAYRIRAKLRAQEPAELAWGLHDAMKARLEGADALVLAALDRAMANREADDAPLLRLAVDAIIELDIPLAPERIRALVAKLPPTTGFILAARDPRAFRDLIRPHLTESRDNDQWTAACNLLTAIRDPVATAHLVDRLKMIARVTVRDPGVELEGYEGSSGHVGSGCGCGQVTTPTREGWPPRSYWTMTATPAAGGRLVAPGREPIYAQRREIELGDFVCSTGPSAWGRDYDAVQYVADLLGCPRKELQYSLWEYRYVEFQGAEAWMREVEDVHRTLLVAWLRVLAACWRDGLLSPAQVLTLRPRIEFEVRDHRTVKDPALPTVPIPRGSTR